VRNREVVLIASADENTAELAAQPFERAGYGTTRLAPGEDILLTVREQAASLVILDLDGDDGRAFVVCRELREEQGARLPVILVSGTRTESADRVAGLLIGADDYLTKPFDPDELLVRAQRLLSRFPQTMPFVDTPLTQRETEVLELLARGLSQEQIARELFISSKTVGTHIQRSLSKLGVHSRAEAVALAYRHGLVEARPSA
jgi:DNA-binding NarL/FixJ family response regulator